MNIRVNGKEQSVTGSSLTISALLKVEKVVNPDMMAVQVNGEFVGKEQYDSRSLKEGDAVDFLYFMGGGQAVYSEAERAQ